MGRADYMNGGYEVAAARVAGNNTLTAAGAGDATEVNGAWIDRTLGGLFAAAMSAKLCMNYTTTLGNSGETLKFGVTLQDADDINGTGAADVNGADGTLAATVASTATSGGSTNTGVAEVDIDLAPCKQFFRVQITPDLSAAGTDTAAWSSVMLLFGADRQPMSQAIGHLPAGP